MLLPVRGLASWCTQSLFCAYTLGRRISSNAFRIWWITYVLSIWKNHEILLRRGKKMVLYKIHPYELFMAYLHWPLSALDAKAAVSLHLAIVESWIFLLKTTWILQAIDCFQFYSTPSTPLDQWFPTLGSGLPGCVCHKPILRGSEELEAAIWKSWVPPSWKHHFG